MTEVWVMISWFSVRHVKIELPIKYLMGDIRMETRFLGREFRGNIDILAGDNSVEVISRYRIFKASMLDETRGSECGQKREETSGTVSPDA